MLREGKGMGNLRLVFPGISGNGNSRSPLSLRESLILHLLFQERYAPSHMWLYTDHILPYNRKHRKRIANVVKLKTQTLSWYNLQAQWNFQGTAHFPPKNGSLHSRIKMMSRTRLGLRLSVTDWSMDLQWVEIEKLSVLKTDKNGHKYKVDLVVIMSWNEHI